MRNHQSCPIGFKPFPKVNAISSQTRGCRWGRGHGCDYGRNCGYHGAHDSNSSNSQRKKKVSLHHQKWSNTEVKTKNWEVYIG